ncbi:MAG: hypothetical protein NTU63_02210 [Candidatus Pacearchaeota archaeon]|nr:hypothetical protein [Candidatus Pacearchaeota archaeon]
MIQEIGLTSAQYSGYFEDTIRKFLKRGEVAPESEEARVQRVLDEERKRIQRIVSVKGKVIEHYEIEKDAKRKRAEYEELGRYVNVFA